MFTTVASLRTSPKGLDVRNGFFLLPSISELRGGPGRNETKIGRKKGPTISQIPWVALKYHCWGHTADKCQIHDSNSGTGPFHYLCLLLKTDVCWHSSWKKRWIHLPIGNEEHLDASFLFQIQKNDRLIFLKKYKHKWHRATSTLKNFPCTTRSSVPQKHQN